MPTLRLIPCAAVFLACLPAGAGDPPAKPDKPDPETLADIKLLTAAGVKADGAALLDFFRRRTLTAEQLAELNALLKRLGDKSYPERERASATLRQWGYKAKPLLLEAQRAGDGETARRAELCLRVIDAGPEPAQAAAAARLLARHQPAGAAAVLLNYLPFAADEPVLEAVQGALNAVAKAARRDPALADALDDPLPLKRAAAAEALARAGVTEHRAAYLKLLNDPDVPARLQVALALFEARYKESIPALITLLDVLPRQGVWRVEEALHMAAAEKAPAVYLDRDTPAAKVRAAWEAWWRLHESSVDLARLDLAPPQLGLTLITYMDNQGGMGNVAELDRDKAVKWKINDLRYPVDAHVVGPNRVLVAEYLGRRVTERDFSGTIHWEMQVDLPVACERLPGGNTFIATRKSLLVVDRDGKEVFTYQHGATSISAARRLRDGQVVFISAGQCVRLDAQGKQVKSFPVGLVYTLGGNIDILPNGRVLVPEYNKNRVVEYDADGKECWSLNCRMPISAVRLPGGNTLVVSMGLQRAVEYDREGREVWSHGVDGRLWRARRR